MVTDEAFRTQYQNATNDNERREVALAASYNFTPEEWEAALNKISESCEGELSDAELLMRVQYGEHFCPNVVSCESAPRGHFEKSMDVNHTPLPVVIAVSGGVSDILRGWPPKKWPVQPLYGAPISEII